MQYTIRYHSKISRNYVHDIISVNVVGNTTVSYYQLVPLQTHILLVMALPHTETNRYLHVRRAHLQMMLWKATDQQGPPNVDITKFGWEVTEGIPSACIVTGLHAPQSLIYVINCG